MDESEKSYGTPDSHATSTYFLQVKTNSDSRSLGSIPLQLISDNGNQPTLEPIQLNEMLQLCKDACGTSGVQFTKVENYANFQHHNKLPAEGTSTKKFTQWTSFTDDQVIASNIDDTPQLIKNYEHIPDRVVPPRAEAVLPNALIKRRDCIAPRWLLSSRVRFGPVQGVNREVFSIEAGELISEAVAARKPIFLLRGNTDSLVYIDVSDKDKSNWFSLLPLGDQSTANVWLYEEQGELFGITSKSIAPRTPLMLGYSTKYAEENQLPSGQPVLDLNEDLPSDPRQWRCCQCDRTMVSETNFQRHLAIHHKAQNTFPKRQYSCPHCARTFIRLFTLKRHISSFCTKRPEEFKNLNNPEILLDTQTNPAPAAEPYITENTDDNKLASDESLPNYSNGLDFSTNLFDTDRMPNLDISGSTRSEIEFNYAIQFKDENDLNDVRTANGASHSNDKVNCKNKSKVETILTTCSYCKETIVKSRRRLHASTCSARIVRCECGLLFHKKESLEQHIHKEHSGLKTRTVQDVAKAKTNTSETKRGLKCDKCNEVFKRRGMLVNHLWRIHNASSAAVPLERRVRHYPCPCGACPKIYRSAAKRDFHVRIHHPDAPFVRPAPIEGETRTYEPAACPECPRQYATRAKMLQHMRSHHPRYVHSKRKTPKKSKPKG